MAEPVFISVEWLQNVQPEIAAMHALEQVMQQFDAQCEHIADQSARRVAEWFYSKYTTPSELDPDA